MSWYRTHRPRQVSALHLQNIRNTLQQFMEQGHIPQVLLFAGPKGTGKTSSARIIGAMLNDQRNASVVDWQFFNKKKPKNTSYQEPDAEDEFNEKIFQGHSFVVQEMDAASNRGIEDVRELKERISMPPQDGKMTVYILDEAHMLTMAAFNALLKLLEEPPAHAVFILATTELHKIPATIKSRCSILHFRKGSIDEIRQALTDVLEKEKVEAEEAALELIAQQADGSFRDAVKMVEMVTKDKKVTVKAVEEILSQSVSTYVTELVSFILNKDDTAVARLFEDIRQQNIDESYFYAALLTHLHQSLLRSLDVVEGDENMPRAVAQFLLKEFSETPIQATPIPHLILELKSLELIDRASQKQPRPSGRSGQSGSSNASNTQTHTQTDGQTHAQTHTKASTIENIPPAITSASQTISKHLDGKHLDSKHLDGDSELLIQNWHELLTAVKKRNMTLEALLRSAKPLKGTDGTAEVAVYYKFHKEQLELPKFRAMIEECVVPIAGGEVNLHYVLSQPEDTTHLELTDAEEGEKLASLAEEVLV